MATIIDPPSGWKYGFPKPIPEDRKSDALVWLVEQGYPQSEIDGLGDYFHYRSWKEDEQITQVSLKEKTKQRAENYMSLKGALEPKDVVLGYKTSLDAQMLDKIEPKQETLEEASWKFNPLKKLDGEFLRHAFIEGAKWQEERMFEIMDYYADDVMGGCNLRAKEWFEQFKNK